MTGPGASSEARQLVVKRQRVFGLTSMDKLSPALNRVIYSRASQLLIDAAIGAGALAAAYLIRFDGALPEPYQRQFVLVLPFLVALHLCANVVFGTYSRVWRFVGLNDAAAIAQPVFCAFVISVFWRTLDPGVFADAPVPFGVLIMYPGLTYGALLGVRLVRRLSYEYATAQTETHDVSSARKRLLLIGAGEAGLLLLRELKNRVDVVGFLDDDLEIQKRTIGGWRVLGTTANLEQVVSAYSVDEVILSIPSAPSLTLQKLAARCAKLPVKVSTVPSLRDIMAGRAAIGQLRSVDAVNMEDLLGRDSITHPRDFEELMRTYGERRILVTGAGGSIGSELVRQLREFKPSQLILLDKDENNLYEIACEVKEDFAAVTEVIADVRDALLMERMFDLHKPEVVFHAAAYKHVPLMEQHPAQAILNNVKGTQNLVEMSERFGVETFVFISTDKAVNPTSTMGASKRVAELIVQERASKVAGTRFCCVRFGNVLGSRASVVPIFQRQLRLGKNITVTHPDVRRYFMTIPEAVQLVLQAGSLGKRGEIFLLDMGDPVKIVDLARNLIELSGFVPDRDVKIEFTGLRPGEKIDEELLIAGESGARSTQYSKIFVVEALNRDWSQLGTAVNALLDVAHAGDASSIRKSLLSLNIGYQHRHAIQELVIEDKAAALDLKTRRRPLPASLKSIGQAS